MTDFPAPYLIKFEKWGRILNIEAYERSAIAEIVAPEDGLALRMIRREVRRWIAENWK